MMEKKRTFREILSAVEKDNSERLMRKARTANKLAKKTRGQQRKRAYAVKSGVLSWLVKKMPAHVRIHEDFYLHDFVVIELKSTNQGLHFPISAL